MRSEIAPGQTSDYLGFDLVMDDNLPEPAVRLADRGYGADKLRETMEARNVVPVMPMRKSRKLRVAVDGTSTACTTSSNGASTSSRTPVAWPPAMTRPPRASWASSTSRRSDYGSDICQHDIEGTPLLSEAAWLWFSTSPPRRLMSKTQPV